MVATLSYSTDSWLTNHHETVLRPLMAEIYHAFVQKAISLLEKTHPSLIPARITDDDSRIPLFAAFVRSIPTEIYEAWGLPGYQKIMGNQFIEVSNCAGDPIERICVLTWNSMRALPSPYISRMTTMTWLRSCHPLLCTRDIAKRAISWNQFSCLCMAKASQK